MNEEQIATVMNSVDDLKAKGVTAIKVELEAQMFRSAANRIRTADCTECNEGQRQCEDCDGTGIWTSEWDGDETCGDCDGIGHSTCHYCGGHWQATDPSAEPRPDFTTASVCFKWLMDKIAEKTGTARLSPSHSGYMQANPFDWMRFAYFYNDGSVDSELTFTVPIDDPSSVRHLPAVLEAFRELGETIRCGFDVQGAGMHMAVLFSEDASYPSEMDDYPRQYDGSNRIPEARLRNFKKSMTQLLPALYFLASTDESSRALRYRMPRVSVDARNDSYGDRGPKYSAITYRLGAFEFRVFDTCYQNPNAVLDNLVVIANCMKFLTPAYKSPGIDRIVKQLAFGTDYNDKLERFYTTVDHIDVLEAGLKVLKPNYYSLEEVKAQRKFCHTKESVANLLEEKKRQIEVEYQEYEERFNWDSSHQELRYRASVMQDVIREMPVAELRTLTMEKLSAQVDSKVAEYMARHKGTMRAREHYINSRLEDYQRQSVGQHTLSFA